MKKFRNLKIICIVLFSFVLVLAVLNVILLNEIIRNKQFVSDSSLPTVADISSNSSFNNSENTVLDSSETVSSS